MYLQVKTTAYKKVLVLGLLLHLAAPSVRADHKIPVNLLPPTAACKSFQEYILTKTDKIRTGSLLIKHKGQTIFEAYDGVVNKDTLLSMWSTSKSVVATLVATALQDGKVKLDDPIAKFFPTNIRADLKDPNARHFAKITVRDLLQMSACFEWFEARETDPRKVSITQLLYQPDSHDMVRSALNAPLCAAGPGKEWTYSTGNSLILMAILRKVYGKEGDRMPWTRLFDRLGVPAVIERDRADNFLGGSYIYMTTEGMARIAELYLNKGKFKDEQVFPAWWVNEVQKIAPAQKSPNSDVNVIRQKGPYSNSFWLNQPIPEKGVEAPYPLAPRNMFYASGLYGQIILGLPTEELVIVRTGHDPISAPDFIGPFVDKALACITGGPEKGAKVLPKPESERTLGEELTIFRYLISKGVLAAMFAKEICSCHFISGLSRETCMNRYDSRGAKVAVAVEENDYARLVRAYAEPYVAAFNGMDPGPFAEAKVYYENGRPACRLSDPKRAHAVDMPPGVNGPKVPAR